MARPTRRGYVTQTLLLFLLSWLNVSAEEPTFALPVVTGLGVEYYDNDEIRFAIFMEKVIWHEAQRLCHSRGGSLVEYTSDGISAFIGRALAESAVGFASLWIGGDFTPSFTAGQEGSWKWTRSQEPIETRFDPFVRFPMTSSPFWVDKPNLMSSRALCLATDRNMHHHALIVGEPCDMKRPYICSLPKANETGGPDIDVSPPVQVGGKTFHFYALSSTWAEAHSQCRLIGMKLAKMTTAQEFRIVKSRMLRQRPVMENAWIGGYNRQGQWIWLDNTPINVDESMANEVHPFIWYRPDNIIMDGCLLADRHVCDHFVYVEAKCDRRRNFICEREKPGQVILPPLIQVNATPYYISSYGVGWHKALNVCKVCLDGQLMQIENTKEGLAMQLPVLYAAMALSLPKEIRHIWIGGYLYGKTFMWTSDPHIVPGDEFALGEHMFEKLHDTGERGRLDYCLPNFTTHYYLLNHRCLNLDRDNQKYYTMYGIMCDYKQHFICKAPDERKLNSSCLGVELDFSPPKLPVNYRRPIRSNSPGSVSTEGARSEKWVRMRYWFYNDYWKIKSSSTWQDAKDSCENCLKGKLIKMVEPHNGQKFQLKMILKALENRTGGSYYPRIWLGSHEFEGRFVSEEGGNADRMPQVSPRASFDRDKCAALAYNGRTFTIVEEECSSEVFAICRTSPDAEADGYC